MICLAWWFSLCSLSAGADSSSRQPGLVPAPSFHLQDLKGRFHRLSDFRGKVLIVNFWATWCAPCREELPSMNRAWEILKDKAVVMLAINVGEDQEAVQAFSRDYPINFQILLDMKGSASQRWGVTAMPTTFLVDSEGKIARRIMGKRNWDSAEQLQQVLTLP